MKSPLLFTLAGSALLFACGQRGATADQAEEARNYNDLQAQVAAITGHHYDASGTAANFQSGGPGTQEGPSAGGQQPVQEQGGMKTITIPSSFPGVPLAQFSVPARWNVKSNPANGAWYVDGPDVKVREVNLNTFMTPNSGMAQVYQQNGGKVRQAISPEQVLQEDMVPQMRGSGYELIASGDAPDVARADQAGLDGLYSSGPHRNTCKANISEWRKGDERIALVMHWSFMESPGLGNWSYYFTRLDATAAQFAQEKQALVAALAGKRYNPAYFAAYAQSEQQKAGQSWSAHNQRMQANQAAFDAQQRTHQQTWGAINDASMGAYNSRMQSMDRTQNATINGIRGEQDATNPYTGEQGKMQSGYDQYWMNRDGQYFGTSDPNYDPNVNSDWTDQWRQVPDQK